MYIYILRHVRLLMPTPFAALLMAPCPGYRFHLAYCHQLLQVVAGVEQVAGQVHLQRWWMLVE
jgi:hypothetical protein